MSTSPIRLVFMSHKPKPPAGTDCWPNHVAKVDNPGRPAPKTAKNVKRPWNGHTKHSYPIVVPYSRSALASFMPKIPCKFYANRLAWILLRGAGRYDKTSYHTGLVSERSLT